MQAGTRGFAVGALLFIGFASSAGQVWAGVYEWPVDDFVISNSYTTPTTNAQACGVHNTTILHAGFDLTSSTDTDTVRAAAAGEVRTVPMGSLPSQHPTNHGMGHVVIIDHNLGEGPFTLYGHLADILVSDGQTVSAGQPIGEMGNTGCGSCAKHLHFEVKRWGVLGNLDDDLGPCWGYTLGHPNLYGYLNPWPYLDYSLPGLQPTLVQSLFSQIVRTGPDPSLYTQTVATVQSAQKFVAFDQYGSWYQIHLPSEHGPATGWIQASSAGGGYGQTG